MVVYHLLQVLKFLLLDLLRLVIVTPSCIVLLAIATFCLELVCLLSSSLFYLIQLHSQLGLLLIVRQLFVGTSHVCLQSLLSHLLIVD